MRMGIVESYMMLYGCITKNLTWAMVRNGPKDVDLRTEHEIWRREGPTIGGEVCFQLGLGELPVGFNVDEIQLGFNGLIWGKFYRRFMVFVLKDSSSSKSSFKTSLEWWKFAGWVTTQASCMGIIIKPQPYEATWVLIFDWWHRPPIEGVTTKWRDDAANLQVNYWTGAIRFVKSSVWKWANYTWNPICGHHVPYHCPKMGCTIFRRLSCDRLHGNHTIVLLVKGNPFP